MAFPLGSSWCRDVADPRLLFQVSCRSVDHFLLLQVTAFQNNLIQSKGWSSGMYATVHQGSGNSEDVLDWSQTCFFFPKGPYYHAELSDGKPSRKSHLHFWCISSTSNVSLLACVKVKNALEVADLLSFSFLLYFFQPIVWTLDPCWVWYFRLGAGQGIPWEHWHLASSVVWGWGLHDENQAGRQFHFRPLNRWSQSAHLLAWLKSPSWPGWP